MKLTIPTVFFLSAFFLVNPSWAYTINTGITKGCHETITQQASHPLTLDGRISMENDIPLPSNNRWQSVFTYFTQGLDIQFSGEHHQFLLLSLILGSRYPDSRGQSISNIKSLREIHRDPSDQDSHFLRALSQDGTDGDSQAIRAAKLMIRSKISLADEYLNRFSRDQIIQVSTYIEFYGLVDVDVWAPAFYLGMAAHTVQDSFSHTIRSNDLRTVHHIANYVDGISFDYKKERDGLRHSWAMDRCNDEAYNIAVGSLAATQDFFQAFQDDNEGNQISLNIFFEIWMSQEPNCDHTNDYCDSKWLEVAEKDPSLPVMEEVFSCTQVPRDHSKSIWFFFSALVVFLFVRVYRSA